MPNDDFDNLTPPSPAQNIRSAMGLPERHTVDFFAADGLEVDVTANSTPPPQGPISDGGLPITDLRPFSQQPAQQINAAGLSAEDVESLRQMARQFREAQIADDFLKAHPEYAPTPANAALLQQYLADRKLPITRMGLENAYRALTGSNGSTPAPAAPVQSQPQPQPQRVVSTGLSDYSGPGIPDSDELSPANIAARMATMDQTDARTYMSQCMVKARQRRGEQF
jgi:hypothetical protein